MKIAITSDYHLGYSEDALAQTAKILETARQMSDVVIAAGDLFDVRVPKQEVLNDAIKLFKTHREATTASAAKITISVEKNNRTYPNMPVIAIPGTHERRTKGLVNAIDVLDSAGVLINCHNKHVIVKKEAENERVAIIGMAGVPEEYAGDVIKAAGFAPLPDCFNIFMFHQTIKEIIPMNDIFMTCDDLPKGFDLYVNGHIHWKRDIKFGKNTLLIPGSAVITQMKKNEMEKKGFWLYDTITRTYEFIYIDSRPFIYRELVFENATVEQVKSAIAKIITDVSQDLKKPLVKLKLRGSLASDGLNASAIDANAIAVGFANAEVYIDKEFEVADNLRDKIELIRKLKTEEKSVSEIGNAVLKEKLRKNKSQLVNDEELFSLLAEGEIEKAMLLVKKS